VATSGGPRAAARGLQGSARGGPGVDRSLLRWAVVALLLVAIVVAVMLAIVGLLLVAQQAGL
jgi:hypothetical protein